MTENERKERIDRAWCVIGPTVERKQAYRWGARADEEEEEVVEEEREERSRRKSQQEGSSTHSTPSLLEEEEGEGMKSIE